MDITYAYSNDVIFLNVTFKCIIAADFYSHSIYNIKHALVTQNKVYHENLSTITRVRPWTDKTIQTDGTNDFQHCWIVLETFKKETAKIY